MELNEEYWDNRYKTNEIGWDLGQVSPPLKAYFDQFTNKEIKILIPGGGNSYEAEYLHEKGFKNVYVVDVSKTALNNIQNRIPDYPKSHLIHDNFFNLDLTFDLIIEQTFFCALNPSLRPAYAVKTHELLSENGKLVGLLFKVPLNDSHPPFGGSKEEYLNYFQPYFQINTMEESYNSIEARSGKELFMILQK
ncbi:methyltransferase domain-containing protein [Oceanihabitans sediminis]|uniref:methyltransferase domain-containing protein n=1 Tax=Oceanihabitans sediminis TaxID=1812012 RepID=UPI00299EE12E|nr:methyltransferase domain-containing protein [Oceanihabitans sediminis]MDX1773517.1 methyltransferase domain-containing protein [Oceanihabitans sediminis]